MSRGFQIAPRASRADVLALLARRPTLIRYQMHPNTVSLQRWAESIEDEFVYLEQLLGWVSLSDAKVVLDMHRHGPLDGDWGVEALRAAWAELATRFRGHPSLAAYGVLNEPPGTVLEVEEFMREMVGVIRRYDKTTPIAVTCPYGDPAKFRWKRPIAKSRGPIWYEVHVYWPIQFTHQGIYDYPPGRRYPTTARWNREGLEKHLAGVREFQRRTRATIYIGEFGCSDHATENDRLKWFQDCVAVFERWRWQWTVHAWREAPVWDVESSSEVMNEITRRWR